MVGRKRERGSLEAEVLACLSSSASPMTVADVRAALGDQFAYTTVLTALSRLYAKQALRRTPRGRAYAYSLVGGSEGAQASMTAHRMRKLLTSGADQRSVLLQFVDGLDDESEQTLRELLERHARRGDGAAEPPLERRRKKS